MPPMATASARRHDTSQLHHDEVQRREHDQDRRKTHIKQWRRDSSETTIQSTDNGIWLASPLSSPTTPNAVYTSAVTGRRTSPVADSNTPIPTPTSTLTESSKVTPEGSQPPSRTPSRSSIKSATADPAVAKLDQRFSSPPPTSINLIISPLKPPYPPPARKPTPPGLPSYDLAQEIARETRARARGGGGARHPNHLWPPPLPLPQDDQAQPRHHPFFNDVPLPHVWNPPRSAHDVMQHHPYLRVAAAAASPAAAVRAIVGPAAAPTTTRTTTTGGGDRGGASVVVERRVGGEVVMTRGTGSLVAERGEEGWGLGYRSWVGTNGCCCLWRLGSEDSSDGDWMDSNSGE